MLRQEYILRKEKKKDEVTVNWEGILSCILVFFISRASIIDKLTPFGLAFIAAYFLSKRGSFFILLSSLLGIISYHGLKGMDYVAGAIIIWLIFNRLNFIKEFSMLKSSLLASIIFTITKLIYQFAFNRVFLYDLFIMGFEGMAVFALTYVFLYSLSFDLTNRVYTNERIVSAFIILALVFSGLHDIAIFGASIKNTLIILFILSLGYREGALIGGTVGIILGMISNIAQPEMPFLLALYGLSGLLSGVFKDLGRPGSILGFLLGNGIVSFYINGYGISFLNIKELIGGFILFLLFYKFLDSYLADGIEIISRRAKDKTYASKKDELAVRRLNEISKVFRELGQTFKDSINKEGYSANEVYELIDQLANSICCACGMRKFCWEEGFYNTYHAMFKMVSLLEERVPLIERNLPQLIRDYCINRGQIIKELEGYFNNFKLNRIWKDRIMENRLLLSEQLNGVADIMEDIAKDIYIDPIFKEDMEEMLLLNLKENKVNVKEVIVVELDNNNMEVLVEVDRAYKKENSLENIRRIVTDTLGMPFKGEYNIGQQKKNRQRFKFIKSNRYSAITEVATITNYNDNVSGDNYTFGENQNSYFVALSDGMGVGRKANNESRIAINLLEKFLEAKFDKELALKTINSILMLKSNDEVFTTFDISLIDLYTGKLQIIKTGAPATFIRKKDRIEVINSKSLPVGILKDIDFNVYEEYLEDGDIIIMMSDGVLEANEEVENVERWMRDVIIGINSLNPKKIADEIISAANRASGGKIKDDMTLLVTKFWKTIE